MTLRERLHKFYPRIAAPAESAPDVVLCAIVVALMGFGVVMVYSASAIEATVRPNGAGGDFEQDGCVGTQEVRATRGDSAQLAVRF